MEKTDHDHLGKVEHKSLSHNKFDNHSFTLHALQRNERLARGGVVAAAYVEGNAEIQAQVKLSVWVRNAFGGRFGELESDGVGTQEHVESYSVEAQGGEMA